MLSIFMMMLAKLRNEKRERHHSKKEKWIEMTLIIKHNSQ
jgi:hypothetical protein